MISDGPRSMPLNRPSSYIPYRDLQVKLVDFDYIFIFTYGKDISSTNPHLHMGFCHAFYNEPSSTSYVEESALPRLL